jgi:hypothetical protein
MVKTRVESVRINVGGKADYIKKDGEDICLLKYNVDFSRGCIAQVRGDLLQEVMDNNGKYAEGHLEKYIEQGLTDQRCDYCYARRLNGRAVTPRIVNKNTIQDFEEHHPTIVRIGKMCEAGHDFYHNTLVDFLKVCKNYSTQTIFTTKMLKYSEEVAKLLKQTKSVVHFSIGSDALERGVVSQGMDNFTRIKNAFLYHKSGVNTTLTCVFDVTQSLEENQEQGFWVWHALEYRNIYGMTVRFLPLRVPAGKYMGVLKNSKAELLGGSLFDSKRSGSSYLKRGNNELAPRLFHQDIKERVNRGIGVCGRVGSTEHCDKCNLCKKTRIFFDVKLLPKVISNKPHTKRKPELQKERLFE